MIPVTRLLSQILSLSLFMFSVPTCAQDSLDEVEIEDGWTVKAGLFFIPAQQEETFISKYRCPVLKL